MQEKNVLSDNLSSLKQKIETGLEELKSSKELYEFKSVYLEGKKSKISELMKEMRNMAAEERAGYGKAVNELKTWAIQQFSEMEERMKEKELQQRYESEKIDLTLPGKETEIGNLHPVTLVINQLVDVFAGMGFEVYEGAEIENDYYNFTALNTPKDHPARDMQDTFYLSPEFLLRTDLRRADPCDGEKEASHQDFISRQSVPFRRRCHPFPDVRPDGGPGGGQGYHPLRFKRNAGHVCAEGVRGRNHHKASSFLFPFHGAFRGSGLQLLCLWR